ncbi:iff5 gpi-anchored protein [Lasius niger]|uniref:Iff5 gpi-anchored protein n=1 Tax=Lasius niger TaxID=67767 RepID=A0A0J7MSA9_LASNI|nr:iff5 gpi-anchored protein [Lasius niger]
MKCYLTTRGRRDCGQAKNTPYVTTRDRYQTSTNRRSVAITRHQPTDHREGDDTKHRSPYHASRPVNGTSHLDTGTSRRDTGASRKDTGASRFDTGASRPAVKEVTPSGISRPARDASRQPDSDASQPDIGTRSPTPGARHPTALRDSRPSSRASSRPATPEIRERSLTPPLLWRVPPLISPLKHSPCKRSRGHRRVREHSKTPGHKLRREEANVTDAK